jgi:hypothetical protein
VLAISSSSEPRPGSSHRLLGAALGALAALRAALPVERRPSLRAE